MINSLIHGSTPPISVNAIKAASPVYIRTALLTITGVTDNTQVKAKLESIYNSEALAEETVDSDTPTGGTNFDISADGLTLTIKGLTHGTVVGVIAQWCWNNVTGTSVDSHSQIDSQIEVNLYNSSSGAGIDLTGLGNGVTVQIAMTYLTED